MKRLLFPLLALSLALNIAAAPRRMVILKVDGLNADLLYNTMRQTDPATGKSRLPWLSHIFGENGVIFDNFYTRGISLSAPSWSMLDTGQHAIIRGNVEYDRYTGHVYDYLNFFPFYIGYARKHRVDMPGVEVLDRAGIPLVIDSFPAAQRLQSFQLFQRGVRWPTLEHVLARRFSSKVLLSIVESTGAPSLDTTLGEQTEAELVHALDDPEILYSDFYTGDLDHQGHATNQPAALLAELRKLDALAGRIWTAIEHSPLSRDTIFVVVSDHGMNNVPGVFSEGFSLPDLFNSPSGGAHHVITNRHQLSDFKIMGLNPLVERVISPSTASFYLAGDADRYPTAWLDVDGNERAAVQLRNSDLNKLHILLLQLARSDLAPDLRRAAVDCFLKTVDRHRSRWLNNAAELDREMDALAKSIAERHLVLDQPYSVTAQERASDGDKTRRRSIDQLQSWRREHAEYTLYLAKLRALLDLQPDPVHPFHRNIADFIPPSSLGDNNDVGQLQKYVVGLSARGLTLAATGKLDEEQSFRCVNYFSLLAAQRSRNNPQPALSSRPIDFTAMSLGTFGDSSSPDSERSYWLYGDEASQLLIHVKSTGAIRLDPVNQVSEDERGVHWKLQPWRAGLPLHLFEDPDLHLPPAADRAAWLSQWHSEREWLIATHLCRYSNAVIGIPEELSPIADYVPGPKGIDPILLNYERRRRHLVEADFHVFAADHWNFNVRNFNPGGNHGGFFRISTHSVWMLAGASIPIQRISDPYDSLNFASTLLQLIGREAPLPERAVTLSFAARPNP